MLEGYKVDASYLTCGKPFVVHLHLNTADIGVITHQLKHSDHGQALGEACASQSQVQDSNPHDLKTSNSWKSTFKIDTEWAYININKYFIYLKHICI